ncbi:hypothetical protein EYF80_016593 [Liparis tanakae]|uniref:Uncharacterized protein n=1 Tax=Liparis tanakae TaxID=230148 RepID=A0A4Z2I515_9TELE|nr:hypothetical protein EYF80_016593 [Liparis tanakae]
MRLSCSRGEWASSPASSSSSSPSSSSSASSASSASLLTASQGCGWFLFWFWRMLQTADRGVIRLCSSEAFRGAWLGSLDQRGEAGDRHAEELLETRTTGKRGNGLTGGHWDSLSAAIICTFSRCSTWEERRRARRQPEEEDEPLTLDRPHLRRGHFHVDDDGRQGGFGELRRMVDGVRVQDHQLQGFGEFEYPLNLTLDLRWTDGDMIF